MKRLVACLLIALFALGYSPTRAATCRCADDGAVCRCAHPAHPLVGARPCCEHPGTAGTAATATTSPTTPPERSCCARAAQTAPAAPDDASTPGGDASSKRKPSERLADWLPAPAVAWTTFDHARVIGGPTPPSMADWAASPPTPPPWSV